MPTQLRETDVVIVGMGAAGGVAAYPLADAGLNVVGLEAGTWLDQRDFAPDEIRNNYRDWPMLVKKAELERPTSRATSAQTANRIGIENFGFGLQHLVEHERTAGTGRPR